MSENKLGWIAYELPPRHPDSGDRSVDVMCADDTPDPLYIGFYDFVSEYWMTLDEMIGDPMYYAPWENPILPAGWPRY